MILNRRKFFKWLGAGTAAAVVAPSAVEAIESTVSRKDPWSNYTETNIPGSWSCVGRSLREGPCEYCYQTKLECGCTRGQCTCPVLQYADYSNFSQFAIQSSTDDMVKEA